MGREVSLKHDRMKKIRIEDEAGGYINAVVIGHGRGKVKGYMKIWQNKGWGKEISELRGESLRVLLHLVLNAKWCNEVDRPTDTARKIGIGQPQVSRAYGELVKAGLLQKIEGRYTLNPSFCWKGDDEQYEGMVEAFEPIGNVDNPVEMVVLR